MARDVPQDVPRGDAWDVARDVPRDVARSFVRDVARDITRDVARGVLRRADEISLRVRRCDTDVIPV